MVALDLPGHGFTSDPQEGDDIGITGQLRRVRQVSKHQQYAAVCVQNIHAIYETIHTPREANT